MELGVPFFSEIKKKYCLFEKHLNFYESMGKFDLIYSYLIYFPPNF